jgi:protein KTI12
MHLISDESLSISRAVYDLSPDTVRVHTRSANSSEKDARAVLYGAVKRVLSDKDIVILDGLNYIGGWRYQLYCEAKALRTPSCVLQVGCAQEWARERNEERLQRDKVAKTGATNDNPAVDQTEAYEENNWKELVMRYEEPNPMKAWDSPLFTIIPDDDEAQSTKIYDSIWEAVAGEGRKIVRPNQATVQRSRDAGGDYLYRLDRETQDVVKRILDQQLDEGGGQVKIPVTPPREAGELVVELPSGKKMGLPQLQRLRRAYIGLNRGGIGLEAVGNMSATQIKESFVWYLNDTFEKDE